MKKFAENREFVRDEFRLAHWDDASGLAPEESERRVRAFFQEHADMPSVLVRAHTFRFILENARIEVNPHTPFAGKIDVGCNYQRMFAGAGFYERIYCERYRDIFSKNLPETWAKRSQSAKMGISIPDTDYWHTCPDWERVFELGIPGLRGACENAMEERRLAGTLDGETEDFYRATLICYDGILAYMDRLIAAAKKIKHTEYAACMERLKAGAPTTLFDAMVFSLFFLEVGELGRERVRSLGNLDLLLAPYYHADLAAGRITEEDAREFFRYYFAKINAGKRYANQPICIGGMKENGETLVSDFTYLLLDVYDEMNILNPKIHVKCNRATPDRLIKKLAEMIRGGNSSLVLLNDEVIMAGYEKIGIPAHYSHKYLPLGCYEPAIPGYEDARICGSWINLAKGVEFAIHGGYDGMTGELFDHETNPEPASFEEFYAIVKDHLESFVKFTMKCILEQEKYAYEVNPHPLYSSTLAGCVKNGKDIFNEGMDVRNSSLKVFAVGTAVDSLLAVKKYVYTEKRLSLPALSAVLKANWEGHDALRAEIIHDRAKWGNGIDEADELAADLYAYMAKLIVNVPNGYGGVYRMGADSVNFAEDYGRGTGASADGRLNAQPLSKNLRPVNGMERRGVTGLINSASKIDQTNFVDGAPLDIMLHPTAVQGEKGIDMLVALIGTYFAQGGVSIQGNVVDAALLERAVEHPEDYQDLQVRVCGWNEYFVNMSKVLQQDFINRAKGIES